MFRWINHHRTVNSLSLNGHLYKTDTWCWSLRAVFQSFYCIETLYKPDTSLRRTVGTGPDGVRLRES